MHLLAPGVQGSVWGDGGFARRKDAAVVAFEQIQGVYINLVGLRPDVRWCRGSGCAGPSGAHVVHV